MNHVSGWVGAMGKEKKDNKQYMSVDWMDKNGIYFIQNYQLFTIGRHT